MPHPLLIFSHFDHEWIMRIMITQRCISCLLLKPKSSMKYWPKKCKIRLMNKQYTALHFFKPSLSLLYIIHIQLTVYKETLQKTYNITSLKISFWITKHLNTKWNFFLVHWKPGLKVSPARFSIPSNATPTWMVLHGWITVDKIVCSCKG